MSSGAHYVSGKGPSPWGRQDLPGLGLSPVCCLWRWEQSPSPKQFHHNHANAFLELLSRACFCEERDNDKNRAPNPHFQNDLKVKDVTENMCTRGQGRCWQRAGLHPLVLPSRKAADPVPVLTGLVQAAHSHGPNRKDRPPHLLVLKNQAMFWKTVQCT